MYSVISPPPSYSGSVHERSISVVPAAAAASPVGAPGTVGSVLALASFE